MRGEDSAGRARLTWFSMKTLSTHPHTKTFWRTRCCRLRKSGLETKRKDGNYKTKRLATRQSPRRLGWRGMRLRWWKSGPPKVRTLTRSRTFGTILDERLESKKFTTEEGMKKAILKLWDEVDLSLLHNLIDSIPDRLRRIRKAEGGSIKAVN